MQCSSQYLTEYPSLYAQLRYDSLTYNYTVAFSPSLALFVLVGYNTHNKTLLRVLSDPSLKSSFLYFWPSIVDRSFRCVAYGDISQPIVLHLYSEFFAQIERSFRKSMMLSFNSHLSIYHRFSMIFERFPKYTTFHIHVLLWVWITIHSEETI